MPAPAIESSVVLIVGLDRLSETKGPKSIFLLSSGGYTPANHNAP